MIFILHINWSLFLLMCKMDNIFTKFIYNTYSQLIKKFSKNWFKSFTKFIYNTYSLILFYLIYCILNMNLHTLNNLYYEISRNIYIHPILYDSKFNSNTMINNIMKLCIMKIVFKNCFYYFIFYFRLFNLTLILIW